MGVSGMRPAYRQGADGILRAAQRTRVAAMPRFGTALLLCALLSGCGNKGPLVKPGEAGATPPPAAPAPTVPTPTDAAPTDPAPTDAGAPASDVPAAPVPA
jgi:hypothetical protein